MKNRTIMRHVFAVIALLTCVLFTSQAFALSDADYKKMLKDPQFAAADRALNASWKQVNADLPKAAKNALKKDQQAWVKSGRDITAKEIMGYSNMSRTEAYTEATNRRAEELEDLADKYMLMATADGYQGYYMRVEEAGTGSAGGAIDQKGKVETGWLSIRWGDKKARELQVSVDVVYYVHPANARSGQFGGSGRLMSDDSIEIDDGQGGTMILRFEDFGRGGRRVEVTTNDNFDENGWGGIGTTFDGTYVRQVIK